MPSLLRFSGAVKREPAIDRWLDMQPGALGCIARTWFTRMRGCGADILELMHDGCPTVCIEDAAFAYVNAFTAHVNVGFFQGFSLADPEGLLQGTGKYIRHVKLRPALAIDERALEALIVAARQDIVAKLKVSR